MKIHYYCLIVCGFLFFSCSETKCGELLTIPVDINQNTPLALSEITESIIAIELELTDESMIGGSVGRIIISEDYVIVAELNQILVFNKDGNFVRSIGRRGQGPGSFNYIANIAIDTKNERLFVLSLQPRKIISYDLNGNFLNEKIILSTLLHDINYVDNKLILAGRRSQLIRSAENKSFIYSFLYRFDSNLQFIDSQNIRKAYFRNPRAFVTMFFCASTYIMAGAEATYFYMSEYTTRQMNPTEVLLRDTLFRLEGNQLVPELRLRFRNDGIDRSGNKFIELRHISRSSRYVFSTYRNKLTGNIYQFVFDTKTGKGYNMRDGFIDDINNTEGRVIIRPLNTNSEMFLFRRTHMHPDDFEEPNPTLYVGRLRR